MPRPDDQARPAVLARVMTTAEGPALSVLLGPGQMGTGNHRAGLGDCRDRCHRREHRPADHRPRLRHRRGCPAVGDERLHADTGRFPADRGVAGRPVRPAENLPDRHRLVRRGLGGVRACPDGDVPDRHPAAAGHRGGPADPRKPGDPGGVVPAGLADCYCAIGAWSGLGAWLSPPARSSAAFSSPLPPGGGSSSSTSRSPWRRSP